jgi:hypothetical protein
MLDDCDLYHSLRPLNVDPLHEKIGPPIQRPYVEASNACRGRGSIASSVAIATSARPWLERSSASAEERIAFVRSIGSEAIWAALSQAL